MQLVMMGTPATDCNTCKKIPPPWDNNESVSPNYSKQGSSAGYRRPSLEETGVEGDICTLRSTHHLVKNCRTHQLPRNLEKPKLKSFRSSYNITFGEIHIINSKLCRIYNKHDNQEDYNMTTCRI